MSKLMVFNSISVDGYFTDTKGDMGWAHQDDSEWQRFTNENVSGDGILLFGRVTYEMMKSYYESAKAVVNILKTIIIKPCRTCRP